MKFRVLKITILIGLCITIPLFGILLYAHQYMSKCVVLDLEELNTLTMLLFFTWIIVGSLALGYIFLWGVEHRLRLLRYIELQNLSNPHIRCKYCNSLNIVVDYENKRIFCRDCERVSKL